MDATASTYLIEQQDIVVVVDAIIARRPCRHQRAPLVEGAVACEPGDRPSGSVDVNLPHDAPDTELDPDGLVAAGPLRLPLLSHGSRLTI